MTLHRTMMAKSTVLQAINHQQPSHGMLTATGEWPAILGLCILAYSLPLHLSILPSRCLPHMHLTLPLPVLRLAWFLWRQACRLESADPESVITELEAACTETHLTHQEGSVTHIITPTSETCHRPLTLTLTLSYSRYTIILTSYHYLLSYCLSRWVWKRCGTFYVRWS